VIVRPGSLPAAAIFISSFLVIVNKLVKIANIDEIRGLEPFLRAMAT
jgi:hypothetical protein